MALPPYDPKFTMAFTVAESEYDQEHDESASAAAVAAELISSTRLALNLDSVRTEYSAQYLLDNIACRRNLSVKGCLKFAMKNGIPKAEDWLLLGSHEPALVYMRGELIDTKDLEEAREFSKYQPVGAKLHVFSPHIELQQDGIYCGSSGEPAKSVGLRDGIIVGVEKIYGKSISTVKVWYKKRFIIVKVALSRMFAYSDVEPTLLLVDFCVPRTCLPRNSIEIFNFRKHGFWDEH